MKYLTCLFAVTFLCNGPVSVAQESGRSVVGESATVGVQLRTFMDEGRKNWQGTGPRPLATVVWYPVAAGAKLKAPDYGTPPEFGKYFVSYPLAEGAEISRRSQKYPFILLSHGTTSSALSLDWLGYCLATRGYIVAAVNHHGDTAAEPGGPLPQGFATSWERAKDLSVLIDKMLADPFFGSHIDANRIGAAGHSAGGASVIELAGGIFSPAQITAWCKSNNGADANCLILALAGKIEESRTILSELKRYPKLDPVSLISVAETSSVLGDKGEALSFSKWLIKSAQVC